MARRSIRALYRLKRFFSYIDIFSRALEWLSNHGTSDSVGMIEVEDILEVFFFHPSLKIL